MPATKFHGRPKGGFGPIELHDLQTYSGTSTNRSFTIPATAQAGDIMVVFSNGWQTNSYPAIPTTGIRSATELFRNQWYFNFFGNYRCSNASWAKVLDSSDPGQNFDCIDGGGSVPDTLGCMWIFRREGGFSSFVTPSSFGNDYEYYGTTGDPAAMNLNAASYDAPMIACWTFCEHNGSPGWTQTPSGWSDSFTGISNDGACGYRIFDVGESGVNGAIDANDAGRGNTGHALLLEVS